MEPDTLIEDFPEGLANVLRGAIIGFFNPNIIVQLQHSMVVVDHKNGDTHVAGVNNFNVLDGNVAVRVGVNPLWLLTNNSNLSSNSMQVWKYIGLMSILFLQGILSQILKLSL